MDDRRFDSLARSLGAGASRRSVLKGLLGLGGAALAGADLSDSEAARRPTPTPKPITCPGRQTPVNGKCECRVPKALGTEKCGPDCCNPDGAGATHSECCDNACCFGTCYGEELCCPTNPRAGELSATHVLCDGPNGPVCVTGACCLGQPCGNEQVCCQGSSETVCCPSGALCQDGACFTPCTTEIHVSVHMHDGGALDTCPDDYSKLATEVGLYPYDDSNGCGAIAIATATSTTDGPAVFPNVPSGSYCPLPTDPALRNCIDCPSYGEGMFFHVTAEPCETMSSWTIGVARCCVDGEKVAVLVHSGSGASGCNEGTHLSGVPVALYDCDSGELLYGPVLSNSDGYADFESVPLGAYCVRVPGDSSYSGCERCQDIALYRSRIEVTCGQTSYPLIGICRQGSSCEEGVCVVDDPCDDACTALEVCYEAACACRPGTYDDFDAGCTLCEPGTYSNGPGAAGCSNCDLNFYQDQPGQTSCLPCAEGFYTEHVGSDECVECNCVLGNMPLICGCDATPCDPGYGPQSGMCVKCLAGSASDGSACLPCSAGTFAASEGQTTCDPCPVGRYSDGIGATVCALCPAGSYQDALGQIGCKPCGYLTYAPAEGSTSCQACACTLDCDSISGGCFQVGPESPCTENADCDTNVCGCGANPMFPDCLCRYADCGPTGSACSYHLDCCIGDCVGDDVNGYFCIAEG